jgi:hypothetical protein
MKRIAAVDSMNLMRPAQRWLRNALGYVLVAAIYGAVIGCGILAVSAIKWWMPWFSCEWVLLLVVVALAVLYLAARVHERRMRRLLEREGLSRCLACRHGLDPTVERGVCPECGTPYTLSKVRKRWWRMYKPGPMRPGA